MLHSASPHGQSLGSPANAASAVKTHVTQAVRLSYGAVGTKFVEFRLSSVVLFSTRGGESISPW
jgi:hypothetical protein